MITNKYACTYALDELKQIDFTDESCSQIFHAIYTLKENGTEIDIITVQSACSGISLSFLSSCTNFAVQSSIASYCAKIKDGSIRLQIMKAGRKIEQLALENDCETAMELKAQVLSMIESVDSREKQSTSISDLIPKYIESLDRQLKDGDNTGGMYGLKMIDGATGGLRPGELTIIAARPSIGKTALALQAATYTGKNKRRVLFYSLEMPALQLIQRMASSETGVNVSKLRNVKQMSENEWERLQPITKLCQLPLDIIDDIYRIENIKMHAQHMASKGKINLIVIDYLQLLKTAGRFSNRYEEVSHISRCLKLMAKELSVPVLALAQLNRANEKDNRAPKLSDLRDSGSLEQDSDITILLDDPDRELCEKNKQPPPNPARIDANVAKNRQGERDLHIMLEYRKGTQQFFEKRTS